MTNPFKSDITHCLDKHCPSQDICQRYTAIVTQDGWISYGDFMRPKDADKCDNFLAI